MRTEQKRPKSDEVVARARELVPAIRGRAEEAERLRKVPEESVAEIDAAGIGLVQRPLRWGGSELGFETAFDVAVEIGRGCASTGWYTSFLNHHDWLLAEFSEAAQAAVWGENPGARVATAFAPAGSVEPVDGGWRIVGDWPWSSGVDYADWVMVSALHMPADGPPTPLLFLVPSEEYRVEDTWFNVGLRGSGSNNVVIDEPLFVPAELTLEVAHLREGDGPGAETNGGAPYRTPMMAAFGLGLLAPALGAARGAFEEWCDWTKVRTATYTAEQIAQQSSAQVGAGLASARIDSAELLLRDNMSRLADPEAITVEDRARNRRNCSFAAQLLNAAMEDLVQISGARGLFDSNSIQRAWRDVRAISCHTGLNPNMVYEAQGRMLLGQPRNMLDVLY
ncbi:MAG TPA: acyl-CoA dehydrogenase family protein [Solirubrobacterales bacterium]|jgi:3-hydroxy-9,10-secoandrosta-1,3,5(10)-triene-9,17-dione monooxygenase